MLGKNLYEEDSSYVLQYEKKKMQKCACTLQNLANAFLIEEKEEKESDRQTIFYKKRLNHLIKSNKAKSSTALSQEVSQPSTDVARDCLISRFGMDLDVSSRVWPLQT